MLAELTGAPWESIPLAEIHFCTRTRHAIRNMQCCYWIGFEPKTAGELASLSEDDLKRVYNLGRKSLTEIKSIVAHLQAGLPTQDIPRRGLTEAEIHASNRYIGALKLRRGGATFKAIGEQFGVGPSCARWLVQRGERIERGAPKDLSATPSEIAGSPLP